ncbi:hypothetical protein NM688_g8488 [Phlebia brevispora]|uniref:Uncharacterized protein n=1 Tax=Phlebia brevispora TaxID=194682 RepID=A0ACC1RU23_9APHY|nr:hypothetical protein NM688_g8488 [Phlebia brevispora]
MRVDPKISVWQGGITSFTNTPSQTTMNVFAIGASRNIGYFAAVRLLNKGATVTFLLRSPSVFDDDQVIQRYVQSGHARLIQGDGLNASDVAKAWELALEGSAHVDLVLFTLGQ